MLWKCVPTATPLFRLAPQLLSFLDPFAGWLAPGSIFHLSSGRELVDATGIVWKGRSGSGSPDHLVRLTHEFRADMCWWRAIDSRPSKRTQNAKDVCFVLGPRAAGRQDLVLRAPASSACAIFADAGLRRRVPPLCEAFGANGGPRGGERLLQPSEPWGILFPGNRFWPHGRQNGRSVRQLRRRALSSTHGSGVPG